MSDEGRFTYSNSKYTLVSNDKLKRLEDRIEELTDLLMCIAEHDRKLPNGWTKAIEKVLSNENK